MQQDFERSRKQRQGSEFFSRDVEFTRRFPVASLANGVLNVTHGGVELTTPMLLVRMQTFHKLHVLKKTIDTRHYTLRPNCFSLFLKKASSEQGGRLQSPIYISNRARYSPEMCALCWVVSLAKR